MPLKRISAVKNSYTRAMVGGGGHGVQGVTSLWAGEHVCQERFHLEVTFRMSLERWAGVLEEGKEEGLEMERPAMQRHGIIRRSETGER